MRSWPLVLVFSCGLAHAAPVTIHGHAPVAEVSGLVRGINAAWDFVSARFGRGNPPAPEIHFYDFDRARETPEWVRFQNAWLHGQPGIWRTWRTLNHESPDVVDPLWVHANVERSFPFPKDFLGLFYFGTNRVQLSPTATFLRFLSRGPDGRVTDPVGLGYYYAAHELLHYVLYARGIRVELHHCIFVTPSGRAPAPMAELADHLVERRLSSPLARLQGFGTEARDTPCARLDVQDRAEALDQARRLDD